MNTDFYNTAEIPLTRIRQMIEQARIMKQSGQIPQLMQGKTMGLLFANPSLRTRLSFSVAVTKMGGTAIDIPMGEGGGYTLEFTDGAIMNGQTKEHIKEAARVISRYCDVIGVRASALVTNEAQTSSTDAWEALKQDTIIQGFMKYATVPVINLESNCFHPNQGMADALTITERLEQPQRKKYVLSWAYHPKPLPVATPHSQAQAAVDLGMEVQIVHPPGWDLDPEVVQSMQNRAQEAGGSVSVTNDRDQAYAGADVVCAKSWGSLEYAGNWDAEREQRAGMTDWIIDEAVMKQTNNAAFMHCLPMRRNVIATDAVVDSPQSAIIDEAENRMWAQLAVLQYVLTV